MKLATQVCLAATFITSAIFAQPSVSGLQNNYSYLSPGAPSYGIAQGSIFIIYGKNMGPTTLVQQSAYPLNKALGGVTIKVTVNGTSTQPIPYYVSAAQIAAILPSNTPVGTGTITVTYNSKTSTSTAIDVVQSAFGILSLNNAGSGMAAAFDAKYNYLSPTNAANPGETILLWGTGIGPATGDESILQTPTNLSNIPAQVWIGGKAATVTYHGRSQYPGLDQVNAVVPAGVNGCNVSLVVQNGNFISNFVSVPVATSGRTCSDANGFSTNDLNNILTKDNVNYGAVTLTRSVGQTTTTDSALAEFIHFTKAQLNQVIGDFTQSSYGSCVVSVLADPTASGDLTPFTYLDAGSISLTGPTSNKTLTKTGNIYTASLGSTFIGTGGAFTFAGTGGKDVGAFTTNLNIANTVKWSNVDSTPSSIPRAQGYTVTWTGGDPNGTVDISGSSHNNDIYATFFCTEKASAGTFTIPSYVLLALPVSTGGLIPATLTVGVQSVPARFNATGLDYAYATWRVSTTRSVSYK